MATAKVFIKTEPSAVEEHLLKCIDQQASIPHSSVFLRDGLSADVRKHIQSAIDDVKTATGTRSYRTRVTMDAITRKVIKREPILSHDTIIATHPLDRLMAYFRYHHQTFLTYSIVTIKHSPLLHDVMSLLLEGGCNPNISGLLYAIHDSHDCRPMELLCYKAASLSCLDLLHRHGGLLQPQPSASVKLKYKNDELTLLHLVMSSFQQLPGRIQWLIRHGVDYMIPFSCRCPHLKHTWHGASITIALDKRYPAISQELYAAIDERINHIRHVLQTLAVTNSSPTSTIQPITCITSLVPSSSSSPSNDQKAVLQARALRLMNIISNGCGDVTCHQHHCAASHQRTAATSTSPMTPSVIAVDTTNMLPPISSPSSILPTSTTTTATPSTSLFGSSSLSSSSASMTKKDALIKALSLMATMSISDIDTILNHARPSTVTTPSVAADNDSNSLRSGVHLVPSLIDLIIDYAGYFIRHIDADDLRGHETDGTTMMNMFDE